MTERVPLVVIIPTKNRHVLLTRALESVFSQTCEEYRVVIVDDGSVDETETFLSTLRDPRVEVIRHTQSRGVNAARNAGLRTLVAGEWAVPLDDDDELLPNALTSIAREIVEAPPHIQVLAFNTRTNTSSGERATGRRFVPPERFHDYTYEELMIDAGLEGDLRTALKWSLFPKYLFSEEINGFEGEWWLQIGKDGIGARSVPDTIMRIDQVHGGTHLRLVAAGENPASFVRAHLRIFQIHQRFFRKHPHFAAVRSWHAAKLAVHARMPRAACSFLYKSLYFWFLAGWDKWMKSKPNG